MEANFWHQKWEQGETGFHENQINPAIADHLNKLHLPSGSRIFVPLCGKTRDIGYLLEHGYHVAGVELSTIAINELFHSLELAPVITRAGPLTHYRANNIDVWAGDLFNLTPSTLGTVDAIYDRAALVALPENLRKQYAAHLITLTHMAPQLLITYEYDQRLYDGPPFSVTREELQRHYNDAYSLELLDNTRIAGGFKGKVDAAIGTWFLSRAKR